MHTRPETDPVRLMKSSPLFPWENALSGSTPVNNYTAILISLPDRHASTVPRARKWFGLHQMQPAGAFGYQLFEIVVLLPGQEVVASKGRFDITRNRGDPGVPRARLFAGPPRVTAG